MIVIWIMLFVWGVVWGSFLNVLIFRLSHDQSPFEGRSKCPSCKKTLSWKYNIPILSFLFLRGKCAYCKKKISWQYPVVEILTGFLFLWWYWIGQSVFLLIGHPWIIVQPIFWLITGMLLIVIFFTDARFEVIPLSVNVVLLLVTFLYRVALVAGGNMRMEDFIGACLSGLVVMTLFGALWLATKGRGFGLGDVFLAPSLGLVLGWPRIVVGIFLAFVLGALVGTGLVMFRRKKMKQTIAFGPFLVIGTVLALMWGGVLWKFYWSLM